MIREVKLKMRKLRKSRYGMSNKRYPVNASTAISFEGLDGRTHRVNLDFDDPRHLYDFFDETLGRDFTNQFKAELDFWRDGLEESAKDEAYDYWKRQIEKAEEDAESTMANSSAMSGGLTMGDIDDAVSDLSGLHNSMISTESAIRNANSHFDAVQQMLVEFLWGFSKIKDEDDFRKKVKKIIKALVSAMDESKGIGSRIEDDRISLSEVIDKLDV